MSAQYSVQYATATALLGCATDPQLYLRPASAQRDDLDRLLARTRVVMDADAEAAYPRSSEARVTVEFDGGRRRSEYRAAPRERDPGAWRGKLGSGGRRLLDDAACDELERCVQDLARGGAPAACLDAMTDAS